MSNTRVRLHFPIDRSVHLGDLRLALMTSLWAWSKDGILVATTDCPGALDDLNWLEVEPDEMVDAHNPIATAALVEALVEEDKAYPCFCTSAELREMPVAPRGYREGSLYDGRCRSLSDEDQKALAKAGRKPSVRLRVSDKTIDALSKRLNALVPKAATDFVIEDADGVITSEFAATLHDEASQTTHVLLHDSDLTHLHQRIFLAQALDFKSPKFSTIANVEQSDGESQRWMTISHLRDSGFHPTAVRTSLLSAGWSNANQDAVKKQAKTFKVATLSKKLSTIDLDEMKVQNSAVLQDMGNSDQVDAIFEHLARRGFAFEDRDKRWRKKFVDLVVDDLNTLADAEAMASHVLTSSVSYDKRAAERLRDPITQDLIDTFEACIKKGKTKTLKDWKTAFAKFRGQVEVPGRSLALIRLVLTAERTGPNLGILTTLLGEEGTRHRLQKARKYRS
jgi:nondiscriminating glutamyl-tRNA synthetase